MYCVCVYVSFWYWLLLICNSRVERNTEGNWFVVVNFLKGKKGENDKSSQLQGKKFASRQVWSENEEGCDEIEKMCQYNSVIKKSHFIFLKAFKRREREWMSEMKEEAMNSWHSQTKLEWRVTIVEIQNRIKMTKAFVVVTVCFLFYIFIIWPYTDECLFHPPLTHREKKRKSSEKKVNLISWWIPFYFLLRAFFL